MGPANEQPPQGEQPQSETTPNPLMNPNNYPAPELNPSNQQPEVTAPDKVTPPLGQTPAYEPLWSKAVNTADYRQRQEPAAGDNSYSSAGIKRLSTDFTQGLSQESAGTAVSPVFSHEEEQQIAETKEMPPEVAKRMMGEANAARSDVIDQYTKRFKELGGSDRAVNDIYAFTDMRALNEIYKQATNNVIKQEMGDILAKNVFENRQPLSDLMGLPKLPEENQLPTEAPKTDSSENTIKIDPPDSSAGTPPAPTI